jgi:uncharacterized protein
MIKTNTYLALLCLLFVSVVLRAQDEVNPHKKLTKQFIGAVKRNEPYKNYRFFDSSFYGRMTEAATEKKVNDFIKKHGPIVAIEKTEVDTQGCKMATATAIKVAKGKFLWYHYYDQSYYIQRFEIDTFAKMPWFYEPEPFAGTNYSQQEILLRPTEYIQLPGTVFMPASAKKVPMVVLVHGSGPHDRNCTMGKNKIFRDIALRLVQQGVGVLVYDKRTYVYQFRNIEHPDSMDYNSETVDDAVEAFYAAKRIPGVDSNRVFVAGHSQGAMLAPLIAKRCNGLKGLIVLAAPGRSLLEILPEQLDYILSTKTDPKEKEETEKVTTAIKWQVKNALKDDLNLKSKVMLPFGARPKYWLFDRNYKVLNEAKKINVPVLHIQGGRDYNVTKKDYELWKEPMAGKPNYKAIWMEELDHLFFEGSGMARPEDALKPNHVSKQVTKAMAEFILK